MLVMMGKNLGNQIAKMLDLPKYTIWFELRCAVNEIVTVKCCYRPENDKLEKLPAIIEEYELCKKEEKKVINEPDLSYGPGGEPCTYEVVTEEEYEKRMNATVK